MEVTFKVCTKCTKNLPTDAFNRENRKGHRSEFRSQCKACEGLYRKRIEQALRNEVFLVLGKNCVHCGFSDTRALQIDHVRGGGSKEHRAIKNSIAFYRRVLADASGAYQLLCANCNWIKRHENDENPNRVARAATT